MHVSATILMFVVVVVVVVVLENNLSLKEGIKRLLLTKNILPPLLLFTSKY